MRVEDRVPAVSVPLPIADFGSSSRALLLFSTMVSGFDNVHIRANIPRLEEAIKYGQSAGDRWGCFLSRHGDCGWERADVLFALGYTRVSPPPT